MLWSVQCCVVWSAVQCCGGLWRVLEGCGGLWRVVEGCGGLWRVVEGCGVLCSVQCCIVWSAVECAVLRSLMCGCIACRVLPTITHLTYLTSSRIDMH